MSYCITQDPEQIRAYEQRIINLGIELARVTELLKESVKVIEFYGDINSWSGEDSNGWEWTHMIKEDDLEDVFGAWGEDQEPDHHDNVGGKRAREFLAKLEIKEILK